jgi:uncharacterized membrane protein YkoI
MKRDALRATVTAGVAGAAIVFGGGGSVPAWTAGSVDRIDPLLVHPIAAVEPKIGRRALEPERNGVDASPSVDGEIREDDQGNMVIVDPLTGEVMGIVLQLGPPPEIKPYTLTAAQQRTATAVRLSLRNAIEVAKKRANGGRVLEVSFEPTAAAATYVLKIYQEGGIWEGKIDADSGRTLGAGTMIPDGKLDADDKAELAALDSASISIVEAVRLAEQHTQGKAIAVAIEETAEGAAVWEIVVVSNDETSRVAVDPVTGQVTQVASDT